MKKNGWGALPNSAVWFAKDWVIKERQRNYIIYEPVRDGEGRIITTSSPFAQGITEETTAYTASAQKDLFDTTDLQNKTY